MFIPNGVDHVDYLTKRLLVIQMSLDIFRKTFMLLNLTQKVTVNFFFMTKNSLTQITTQTEKVEIQPMISPSFLELEVIPLSFFFSEEGDPIIPLTGYFNVRQIEPYLKMIKRGDYAVFKDSDDIEKYIENFTYRFRQ